MATINGTPGRDIRGDTADADVINLGAGNDILFLQNLAGGADAIDLGPEAGEIDTVIVNPVAGENSVRLTFNSAAVGNGSSIDDGLAPPFLPGDGNFGVRLQRQDNAGTLIGVQQTRIDDEGVTFLGLFGLTFDVRDLVSGAQRGLFSVVSLGTIGADFIVGQNIDNVNGLDTYINGGAGDDTQLGQLGDDFLVGGDGADNLSGGGVDFVGGPGDRYIGGAGNDTITGSASLDTIVQFNVATDGSDSVNLGGGIDIVNLTSGATGAATARVNLRFTSGEVGNGSATDSNTQANQDGGLAARVQLEGAGGTLTGAISRFDDEGTIFIAGANTTLSVTDLPSGVGRGNGNDFQIVQLGTAAAETINVFTGPTPNLRYYVNAGNGADTIIGGNSTDTLVGSAGNDTIDGGGGNDELLGGGDNDTLFGNVGDDVIDGGAGNDTGTGGLGVDFIFGRDGNDGLSGSEGDDFLFGEAGSDALNGDTGNDRAEGGDGNDIIDGGDGNDGLFGQGGDDIIQGGALGDFILGGDGNDDLAGGDDTDLLGGELGDDRLDGGAGGDNLFGGLGNDFITGDTRGVGGAEGAVGAADTIDGQEGNDFLLGGLGNDQIAGGIGDDLLGGESGQDNLNGGDGNDNIFGGVGIDLLNGGIGNDFLDGQEDGDAVNGGAGDDNATGGAGTDQVRGDDGNDVIRGGADGDFVFGGFGNDIVAGDDLPALDVNGLLLRGLAPNPVGGNDELFGDEGNDLLYGGAGFDRLTGGNGNDTFLFRAQGETGATNVTADVITDFVTGQDRIDLVDIDANVNLAGDQGFLAPILVSGGVGENPPPATGNAGRLEIRVIDGQGVYIYGYTNDDAVQDFVIAIGTININVNDFVL